MDWEPNERDAWVADAQRWIGKINGVLQCKIDLDADGEVTGIHVVAGMDREPRHIVRDVESLLKARLGMAVYYKKIGVVQVLDTGGGPEQKPDVPAPEPAAIERPSRVEAIHDFADVIEDVFAEPTSRPEAETTAGEPAAPVPGPAPDSTSGRPEPQPAVLLAEEIAPRLVCNGVGTMASDQDVRAEVILQAGDVEARGTCDGPNAFASDLTLVARATLAAITRLVDEPVSLHLNEIRQEEAGGRQIILTAVDLVEGRRNETYFGTCACEHNRQQAVVYSILDALNRRLTLFALKTAAPERSAEATA